MVAVTSCWLLLVAVGSYLLLLLLLLLLRLRFLLLLLLLLRLLPDGADGLGWPNIRAYFGSRDGKELAAWNRSPCAMLPSRRCRCLGPLEQASEKLYEAAAQCRRTGHAEDEEHHLRHLLLGVRFGLVSGSGSRSRLPVARSCLPHGILLQPWRTEEDGLSLQNADETLGFELCAAPGPG